MRNFIAMKCIFFGLVAIEKARREDEEKMAASQKDHEEKAKFNQQLQKQKVSLQDEKKKVARKMTELESRLQQG